MLPISSTMRRQIQNMYWHSLFCHSLSKWTAFIVNEGTVWSILNFPLHCSWTLQHTPECTLKFPKRVKAWLLGLNHILQYVSFGHKKCISHVSSIFPVLKNWFFSLYCVRRQNRTTIFDVRTLGKQWKTFVVRPCLSVLWYIYLYLKTSCKITSFVRIQFTFLHVDF